MLSQSLTHCSISMQKFKNDRDVLFMFKMKHNKVLFYGISVKWTTVGQCLLLYYKLGHEHIRTPQSRNRCKTCSSKCFKENFKALNILLANTSCERSMFVITTTIWKIKSYLDSLKYMFPNMSLRSLRLIQRPDSGPANGRYWIPDYVLKAVTTGSVNVLDQTRLFWRTLEKKKNHRFIFFKLFFIVST